MQLQERAKRTNCAKRCLKQTFSNKYETLYCWGKNKVGSKNDNANAIIDNGNLPYHFSAITFGTFGAFGTGTWRLINTACDEATHPKALDDYDPWSLPGPKRSCAVILIAGAHVCLNSTRHPV